MPDLREAEVERAIARIVAGEASARVETETLDCKEDPSRRGSHGRRGPGEARSEAAAYLLAEACACLANHEGGAVLVGLADRVGGVAGLIGTDLEGSWLRRRVRELTAPPLVISARQRRVEGVRLLALLVPRNAGAEPHAVTVSRSGGRRRPRRIETQCQDMVALAEQIAWLEGRHGHDWSAAPSGRRLGEARAVAIEALRDYLGESSGDRRRMVASHGEQDLLRRLQLLRDDGVTLTRGGARLLCASDSPGLVYFGKAASGIRAEVRIERAGRGLIEDLRDVERAIDGRNRAVPLPTVGLTETTVRAIAPRAIREALVNAIMHRDYDVPEPITVEHTGDELVAFSPGGLFGGITIERLLTAPSRTRNRRLAGAFRSLRLAEREGTGVDLMYIEQIRLGHPAPSFRDRDGGVRVTLTGGNPEPSVVAMHAALPERLRADARTAVAIDALRKAQSITQAELAEAAQDEPSHLTPFLRVAEQGGLLQRTARPRPDGQAAWRFSDRVREALGPLLPYHARPLDESVRRVGNLAEAHGKVRNQDVQTLLGLTSVRASQVLKEAERRGLIRLGPGSAARGRSVWYTSAGAGDTGGRS